MNMKKYWFKTALFMMATATAMVACDNDDPTRELPVDVKSVGAYFVNNGNWNQNNGSIQFYDYETGLVSADLYQAANGKGIGDVQDLCIHGSKLYVACSTSSKIEVLTLEGKIIKTLSLTNEAGQPLQPRYLEADGGKVYFTSYDGTVSRLDTLSLEVDASVEVGPYPEALSCTGGKLYVNISNYSAGKQVAVVNLSTFTKEKDIEVLLNPYNQSLVAGGKVYFVSCGTYDNPAIPAEERVLQTLQSIDPATGEVKSLCQASTIAYYNEKMYCIYADFYTPDKNDIFVYDLKTGEKQSIISPEDIPNPTQIDVDPSNGDIYIASPDYTGAPSTVYVFKNDGTPKTTLEAGISVAGVRFLQQ